MPLVSAANLAAQRHDPDLRLVDARYVLADPAAARAGYRAGHVPGAQFADLADDLSGPKSDPRLGRHPLPDAMRFGRLLARLGIHPGSDVVVYDLNDAAMAASRFWLLMQLAGHARVRVLDGGLDAWQAAGLPVDSRVPQMPATDYPVSFRTDLLVSEAELKMLLRQPDTRLLDARAAPRFRGEVESIDPKAGHIPGALNRPYQDNLGADGLFKPAAQLREEFAPYLADGRALVLSCGSGVTACHHALALAHAGHGSWRLFAPGWSGWIADPDNPVATGA